MIRLTAVASVAVPLAIVPLSACAQTPYVANATSPLRYAAAHGQRGLLGGNAVAGLEAWVYPLQVLRGLKPSFIVADSVRAVPGDQVVRSITYTPTSIVRTFAGDNFTVRETLFVPRDVGGAILSYEVESKQPVAVQLQFVPVLDLMWPVGFGGQEIAWKRDENAYEMQEPTGRFHAVFGSPDIVEHDGLVNTNLPLESEHSLRVVLKAGRGARFLIAGSTSSKAEAQAAYARLRDDTGALQGAAVREQQEWAAHTVHIDTPDAAVNNALAWSQWAVEQAWVCSPTLGCGLVAGYGPSRGLARRPQYAWFFAGDALTTMPSMLLSGEFERTRQALEFLLKYQNTQTGMMWHEMSQSASYVHWTDYPYMFPHVDITFHFLQGMQDYVTTTGDVEFLRTHWQAVTSAFDYCKSLVDPADGLPRVPAGKEGGDEQRHPREELTLAVAWMQASAAFAELAPLAGHAELAPAAKAASARAAAAIPAHFWNAQTNFFASGILSDGSPEPEMHLPPPAALPLLDPTRRAAVLNRMEGPEFQTAWGTRGVGSGSPTFDPNSYATGSVWAKATTTAAAELWASGRTEAGWKVWQTLLPWFSLDSMGHVHETLSGSAFHPQIESVPEQTWSSASFVSSFLGGAAGLKLDAETRTISFAPVLPPSWDHLGLDNVRVGKAVVGLHLHRSVATDELEISSKDDSPLTLRFTPGRTDRLVANATLDGHPAPLSHDAALGAITVKVEGGTHRLTVRYRTATR